MLLNPKRKVFRVCAAGDADAAFALSPVQVALLGYPLASGATGLVPYGPIEIAGPATRKIATPAATPSVTTITYTRLAGPVDVPLALAITIVLKGFCDLHTDNGALDPHGNPTVWKAGTIAGEVDIPILAWDAAASSGMPMPVNLTPPANLASGSWTMALAPGAWVADA